MSMDMDIEMESLMETRMRNRQVLLFFRSLCLPCHVSAKDTSSFLSFPLKRLLKRMIVVLDNKRAVLLCPPRQAFRHH